MEHIRYECKKFMAFRFFWILCAVFFLFNLWGLSEQGKMGWFTADAVKNIYADLKKQPEEKQAEWLQETSENKQVSYTGNRYMDEELYKKISGEIYQNNRYDAYLEEIELKSLSMSSAIFSQEDSFANRNAKKTPAAFEKLRGLELKADISDGVILATQVGFTDLCMILMMVAMVYFLVLYEKKNKLYALLKTSYRGRSHVIGAKLAVAAVITCILVLVFYGGNYLYASAQYGFGSLSRPIQSVTTMYESPYKLTVGQFLVLYLILKAVVCYGIALMMIWIALKMSTPSGAILGIGLIGTLEYVLSVFLPAVSYADVLKYVNLTEYVKVYPLLSKYHNLDFFEFPVNAMKIFVVVLPVLGILFIAWNVRTFCRCEKSRAKRSLRRRDGKGIGFISAKLFPYELSKSLLTNRTLFLCLAVLYGAVLLGRGMAGYQHIEENYYRLYMTKHPGHLTQETLDYFNEEKQRFDEVYALTPENSGLTTDEIAQKQSEIQYVYAGFMRAYGNVGYVLSNNQASGVNERELVYDTGYERVFGDGGQNSRLPGILLCVIVAIYCASSVLGMEYDLKVMNLLKSTKLGRGKLLSVKICVASGITFLMSILIKLPSIIEIAKVYPMENWTAKVRSMQFAGQSVFNCSIWEYVFLLLVAQICTLFVIIIVVVTLSAILKDTIMTTIFSTVLFAGPLIMEWSGLRVVHFRSMNALLDAHRLLQSSWGTIFIQILVFWICLPLASSYVLYEIYDRRK